MAEVEVVEPLCEESKDASPIIVTDEDEFKSAESKTPPSNKFKVANDESRRKENDDSTVTEQSSDNEERFDESISSKISNFVSTCNDKGSSKIVSPENQGATPTTQTGSK